jgi:hypothetical protein
MSVRTLRDSGFRISDEVVRTALQHTVGEEWNYTKYYEV